MYFWILDHVGSLSDPIYSCKILTFMMLGISMVILDISFDVWFGYLA